MLCVCTVLLGTGCGMFGNAKEPQAMAAPPAQQVEPKVVVATSSEGPGLYEPTSERSSSVVHVEKFAPPEVRVGEEYVYEIHVTNLTESPLREVTLTDRLPEKFTLKSSDPAAVGVAEGKVAWNIGDLGPEKTAVIKVKGVATGEGTNVHCGIVTYKRPYCVAVKVVNPVLELVKTAPAEVIMCDPIPLKLVVRNRGTGTAKNVQITDTLPDGMRTSDGKTTVMLKAGTLEPGQSREFTVDAKATRTGEFVNKAVATADGGMKVEATAKTIVRKPALKIVKTGPAKQYFGRTATYEITLTNQGDADARNTVLTDMLPNGAAFVSASDGGKRRGGEVVWDLGTLAPKGSKKVSLTLRGDEAGIIVNTAVAKAYCNPQVTASAQTEYIGVPAVLLEVVDVEDPIEVGDKETYVITVTNQGTAADTNIRITCVLEANMDYVSSSGDTKGAVDGRTVTFAPLATLGPKAKATWKVVVKAVKTGDVRFSVSMQSDQLKRPVAENEATNIYE